MQALDGNAIAGTLFEHFGTEMTTMFGTCAHCGTRSQIAELAVYTRAPRAVGSLPTLRKGGDDPPHDPEPAAHRLKRVPDAAGPWRPLKLNVRTIPVSARAHGRSAGATRTESGPSASSAGRVL